MNIKKEEWKTINSVLRELQIDKDSRQINMIKIHGPKESWLHFMTKVKICWDLYQKGHPFLTEAWANNRKSKFDIVDLLENEVIEIDIKSKPNRKEIPTKITRICAEPQAERDF